MSSSDRPPDHPDALTPEEQPSAPISEQSTLDLTSLPAETPQAASESIYEQPTIIGSQAFQPPSGPLPQAPDAQPFQPLSGPIAPAAGLMPGMMPSGPLPQPPAPPVLGSSSRGGFRWALAFALFGLVLAVAGGLVALLTPGPSPAFASEQHNWVVNPVIGLPTVIAGLLLLVMPFVLPVALKPFAQKAGQAGASATPALAGALPPGGAAAPIARAPMEAAPPMAGSQPWPSASGPMPPMPDAQPFQPPSGPLPPMPDAPSWPPSGPTGPS